MLSCRNDGAVPSRKARERQGRGADGGESGLVAAAQSNKLRAMLRRAVTVLSALALGLSSVVAVAAPASPAPTTRGVVAAAEPRAAAAGQEILREGGSAADAAMAIMLVLTVTEPMSSGIGGGGFLVHHDAKTGAILTIDGRETAPASAGPDRFLDADGRPLPYMRAVPGGYSVGVPGNIALMAEAHARWGRLPWAKLFEPAIRLAEQGYTLLPDNQPGPYAVQGTLAFRLKQAEKLWADFPEARAIYWKDGRPLESGETVRNPALAATLRAIAAKGPDAFYKGEIADEIRAAIAGAKRNPTVMTAADLAGYRAKPRPAICGAYRGYRICGMGPPSSGAITDLMMLGMLERFDLKALGKDSPVAWHLIGEAMRLAYADRDAWLGDTDFVAAPVAGLLDPAYLAERSKLIAPDRTLGEYRPGTPPGAGPLAATPAPAEQGTTHFVAVDAWGNIASMTSTVEGPFGSSLVAGGFFLNNELTDFNEQPREDGRLVPNHVQPGKRPLSSMAPTIVYGPDGRPVMALGSAGGRTIIMHSLKALIGTIDWGLPAADAIALPNLFFRGPALIVERNSPLEPMIPALARLGETAVAGDIPSKLTILLRTPGGWTGAADPRSPGVALGW
ncbi:gamma-glutamyltransferase [Rhizorhabdus wittichii RW1]|uniref:Glutathione hydrolase proenzyme n=1 Tax=Rhizorhabdus wittichii (strain DSM 6014 / CCUG 31198 / JCM 15750 / NBRC 105917 / EY 4224 / RW1) TaxID=392499 RepID=A0A9J9HC77_RHIWR|nr:gamma-glutamyltransferase [Rhizorhabdus wittichii RW1]